MSSSLTTTYFGHRISIEPFEWGYLAQIVEPHSGRRFIAASPSAIRALEDAFEVIDGSANGGAARSATKTQQPDNRAFEASPPEA
jgi:hypothetical protein